VHSVAGSEGDVFLIRFAVSLALAAATMPALADDTTSEAVIVKTAAGPLRSTHYAVPGEAARPAVLVLHGDRGFDRFAAAYKRYAIDLRAAGIDAWLVSYHSAADAAAMSDPDRARRTATYHARMGAWAKAVDNVAGLVLARTQSSCRVGLLGFSNGAGARYKALPSSEPMSSSTHL
jgi:dienelactone hydrolase